MSLMYHPITYIQPEGRRTLHAIMEAVSRVTDVRRSEIYSTTRKQRVVEARRLFCFVARENIHMSTEIARFLNKNHATVLHHSVRFTALYDTDAEVKRQYHMVMRLLQTIGPAMAYRKNLENIELLLIKCIDDYNFLLRSHLVSTDLIKYRAEKLQKINEKAKELILTL